MGNPHLEVTLDFALSDDTVLFIDKCVTNTHGSAINYLNEEGRIASEITEDLYGGINGRTSQWRKMFSRKNVYTVGGVVNELYQEHDLLGHIKKYMVDYRDTLAASPFADANRVAKEDAGLSILDKIIQSHTNEIHVTRQNTYTPQNYSEYDMLREEIIHEWITRYGPDKNKNGYPPTYADPRLVAASLCASSLGQKSGIVTCDARIGSFMRSLYKDRPVAFKERFSEPIETYVYRPSTNRNILDRLKMMTYTTEGAFRTRVPIKKMLELSQAGKELPVKKQAA